MTRPSTAGSADLPTGTVTFFFSDIEGSTRLVQAIGAGFKQLIERHDTLIRAAIEAEGGVEVRTVGDAFFVAFPQAPKALAAAVAAQRALAAESWPGGAQVRVRMGLHTGTGTLGGGDYVGIDVHVAARVASAAHGGQVLLSDATASRAVGMLPAGVELVGLGLHRLKDIESPQRLCHARVQGLPADFPPPRTLDARPHNLPTQLTRMVGRTAEADAVERALEERRQVTLLGPGGTGKTRLALQVASRVLARFDDGVWFAALASVREPERLPFAVLGALGLRDGGGVSAAQQLADHLRDRRLLLVLDNFEQISAAAPLVSTLLEAAPGLKVLVTSRVALGIHGERRIQVPPLPVPDPAAVTSLADLGALGGVALFVDRVRDHSSDFALDADNAAAVASIVARLDGLPLAIELAAARIRMMSAPALAQRLEKGLSALGKGGGDLPERHQTLRAAIAWSYDLLAPADRTVFRSLGVFEGGFSLDDAEALLGGLAGDVVESLGALVDHSLIAGETDVHGFRRFRMLETLREFAAEQAVADQTLDDLRRRHAAHYADVCRRASLAPAGSRQFAAFNRLSADLGNLRAGLRWSLETGAVEIAADLVAPNWRFWHQRGHVREGREHLAGVLASCPPGPIRIAALEAEGGLAYWDGDYAGAVRAYEEELALAEGGSDPRRQAEALFGIATTLVMMGRRSEGAEASRRSRAIFESIGDTVGAARALSGDAVNLLSTGDGDGARALFETALRELGGSGEESHIAQIEMAIGATLIRSDRMTDARSICVRALRRFVAIGDLSGQAWSLDWLAMVEYAHGHDERAVELAATAAAVRRRTGGGIHPSELGFDPADEGARRRLSAEAFESARVRGDGTPLGEQVARSLADGDDGPRSP